MEAQDSKELQSIEKLRSAWSAFAEQIGETINARASANLPQPADLLAIGQESTKLGLQIQLWAFDAKTQRLSSAGK